ncbi:putative quinol monooxygenase [Streptomyces niveiscabiei]|uniref:Quinol monooxygenase n=1 Tax=Streptomyces niveiscabiei TaxID=164115 RepID=A0ABW9HKA5_9ACTN
MTHPPERPRMVLELATFHIDPDREAEFLAHARRHAAASTRDHEGCHSMQFGPDAEREGCVHGVVHWSSREAHTRFLTTDERLRWRADIDPLLTAPPDLRFVHTVEVYP